MPIVEVKMMEGRTDEQKEKLIDELTQAAVRAINAPQESIRVIIHEIPKTQFGIGGKTAKSLGR